MFLKNEQNKLRKLQLLAKGRGERERKLLLQGDREVEREERRDETGERRDNIREL